MPYTWKQKVTLEEKVTLGKMGNYWKKKKSLDLENWVTLKKWVSMY